MRRLPTALACGLAAAVLLAPPASARAPCPVIPADPADWVRIARSSRHVDGVARIRSTLAVCERGGRRVVLRRARLLDPLHGRGRGVRIGGAAAAGRRVAWIEVRFAGRRRTVVVFVVRVDARGDVVTLRRQIVSRDRSAQLPDVDVAITDRGELAWLRPRSRNPEQRNDIVYDPPYGRPRRVGTDDAVSLAIEDGHTLRWNNEFDFGFFDLPRPGLSGCRHRSRHRTLASNPEVLVRLRAYYGDEDDGIRVTRACRRSDGRERVVSQSMSGPDRRAVELDSGPPGTVAGLHAECEGFAWTREGLRRSSPAP